MPVVLALLRLARAQQQRAQALAYADAPLLPFATRQPGRRAARGAVVFDLVLWTLLACAAAGPRQPLPTTADGAPTGHRMAVMVLLDTGAQAAQASGSISPLEQARLLLAGLWPRLQGERLGLMAYGSPPNSARISLVQLLPPTHDAAIFGHFARLARQSLLTTDQATTALSGLFDLARRRLAQQDVAGEAAALLLVAGADVPITAGSDPRALGRQMRAARLPVFVLALPGLDTAQAIALRTLADSSGGVYAAVPPGQTSIAVWTDLYDRGIARIPVAQTNLPQQILQWRELFELFLLPALLLMLWRDGPLRARHQRPSGNLLLLMMFGMLATAVVAPPAARAAMASPQQAWTAWQAKDYARAQAIYAALPGWNARMGEGAAAYRSGEFQRAAQAWQRALLDADTAQQRFAAFYNLGNASMHLPGTTLEAVQAYDAALRIRPHDSAALRNARLAQRQYETHHPPGYLVGIAKRGPAVAQGRFGRQSSDTPSQMRHKPPPLAAAPLHQAEVLAAQGKLGTLAAPTNIAKAWQPPMLDWASADKRTQLLRDATQALWQARADIDSRAARDAAAQEGRAQ
ncbi:hypothetical protein [Thiomonas sp. FB-Cd]|uniref:Uncharacterized protein n=1 Tax=mine drainage metagenome TaxID=410659 RepID=E6PNZ3_9ZZZZ|nr:hypothetical protein [Thiomonas sp. FB-Cd]